VSRRQAWGLVVLALLAYCCCGGLFNLNLNLHVVDNREAPNE